MCLKLTVVPTNNQKAPNTESVQKWFIISRLLVVLSHRSTGGEPNVIF